MEIKMEGDSSRKRQRKKMEKYQGKVGKLSKEEVFLKRMEMKEIKENIWVQRCTTNSHEDHTKRMEIEKKKEQKEKVRKRKKLSDEMEENEEKKRKETFIKNWKERE
jgi:hypothetical protein